jgi:hypothetical protein
MLVGAMHVPRYCLRWSEKLAVGPALRIGRKRYAMTGPDLAVRRFLEELGQHFRRTPLAGSLFPFRRDFRLIECDEPVAGLLWWVLHYHGLTRKVAIWLLGRIRHGCDVSVIANCQGDADPRVRRHAAKALSRLAAWGALRDIAAIDPDAVVRRIAEHASQPPAEFRSRLSRFLKEEVKAAALATGEPSPLLVNATIGVGLPPKSSWFIRRILERIRRLVRGL